MKYVKLLSLSLVVFTLFGCNKPPQASQVINPVETANTPQEENSAPQQAAANIEAPTASKIQNSSPRKVAINKAIVDESSYQSAINTLEKLTAGCTETKQSGTQIEYRLCEIAGKPVKAGAYSTTNVNGGYEIWFNKGKVIAVQTFYDRELFVYNNDGTLSSKFTKNLNSNRFEKVRNISNKARKDAEQNTYNLYQNLSEALNVTLVKDTNPATPKQNSSSQYGTLEELNAKIKKRNGRIIGSATCDGDGKENDVRVDYNGDGMPDECVTANLKIHPSIQEETLETVSSTLNYFAKGCQTTSKTQGDYNYYICKKDGEIVKAIKSQKESASSVYYWFENGKPLAIQRIDDSNQSSIRNTFFVYYPNGELSSIFDIFGGEGDSSKRILNFNNGQLQEAKKLINGYQDIYQVFGIN